MTRKMLQRDPDARLGLLEFMDMEYYSYDNAEIERQIAEVV